jgi:L-histidine N-alpha-methyltransferase
MPEASTIPQLYEVTRRTLQGDPKELPAVWLYDERGSQLYERITRLPNYYLPRRETELLHARAREIAGRTRAATLVELGSGDARRTRFLLDALTELGTLRRFAPVDVSEQILRTSAAAIAADYPALEVEPIAGDFGRALDRIPAEGPRLVAFLGSTLGNLYPAQRAELLTTLAGELDAHDALLLGLDLVKDTARLVRAYHDPTEVTEAFVRNALVAVNRELDATFDQRRFAYDPRWDPQREWMDIGLRALAPHTVSVRRLGLELAFAAGERLRVEISAKFRPDAFERELAGAGLAAESSWADHTGDFALVLARPQE